MTNILRMIREEPYRIFFPLGVLAGIGGVLLWPLFFAGWLGVYPGEMHTRMMVEGFMGAFVVGFLGTAFPRLTGNRPWHIGELLLLLTLWVATVGSLCAGQVRWSDGAFCLLLAALFIVTASRWILGRKDTPPPGFVLAFAGIAGACLSAGMLGFVAPLPVPLWQWSRLWLFQGFLVLPLMGIGPYILPRFFGKESTHDFEDSRTPPVGWWKRAGAGMIAGLIVVASFGVEVHLNATMGQLLRAVVIAVWFAMETPVLRRSIFASTPANSLRWALGSLVVGLVCAAFWPSARVGSLHLFFASGLGLMTLTVGTRVILGHAGHGEQLKGKLVWLRWVVGLCVLAATTRMTADFIPAVRETHLIYAACTWAGSAAIWFVALGRYLLKE